MDGPGRRAGGGEKVQHDRVQHHVSITQPIATRDSDHDITFVFTVAEKLL